MDCSLPGSFVQGIFQARILELVAISSSRGSSQPRDRTPGSCVSCIAGRAIGKAPLKYLLDLMVSASENIASSQILQLPAQQLFLGSLHTVYTVATDCFCNSFYSNPSLLPLPLLYHPALRWLGPFSLLAVPQPFSPFPPQTGLSLEASLVVSLVINSSFLVFFCLQNFASVPDRKSVV